MTIIRSNDQVAEIIRRAYEDSMRNTSMRFVVCRGFKNARSGLCGAKRAALGRISDGQRPCCTYKGWMVLPTGDDRQIDVDK